jgi:ABC-type polysaccharide/polyol phosphate transport system ATPase subunit
MAIIEVNHVTKEFRLGQLHSLRQTLRNAASRVRGHSIEHRPPFTALDDVDFKVEQGEVLGIIGHNGAGKSTLLKLLAGISRPTRGAVSVRGRVAPLIEVGAGLVPDLTGRENIYLNATILGMKRSEIAKKLDDIVAFSELEQFVDTPVKRYSSGMQVRLGFSIATSVDAEVLIVDEVLAVGDLAFQRKCFDRMEELIKDGKRTVLLVSHNIRQVARICSRVMLVNHGKVIADGETARICNLFYELSDKQIHNRQIQLHNGAGRALSSGEIELCKITVLDSAGVEVTEVEYLTNVTIVLLFKVNRPIRKPIFGLGVHTTDFLYLATDHCSIADSPALLKEGVYEVRCEIHAFPFLPGTYALRVGVAASEGRATALYIENAFALGVKSDRLSRADPDVSEGFVAIAASWQLPNSAVLTRQHQRLPEHEEISLQDRYCR